MPAFCPRIAALALRSLRPAAWIAAAGAMLPGLAPAQGFAVFLSPSRFEIAVKPGETRREILEFHHVGLETGRYRIYTNDWEFQEDHSVRFSDAPAPDSCRPWVAIERREISIASNGRYRYRFEVTPPAGTPARECRFALMVEGLDTAKFERESLSFPVAGRIGVIVYARVGDAAPQLAIRPAGLQPGEGGRLPVLEVSNAGNAHGRLEGFLTGTDAAGTSLEMAPDNSPILPGRKRSIVLRPVVEEGRKAPEIRYPLTVKGTLEWGTKREAVDLRFEP